MKRFELEYKVRVKDRWSIDIWKGVSVGKDADEAEANFRKRHNDKVLKIEKIYEID